MHHGSVVSDDLLDGLLRRYIETGRESAVEDLVARTRPRLLGVARRIGAPQDAEDSVQAAYLALVRRREPLDAPVMPWLVRAVIRIAYRRKAIERRQHSLAARLERPRQEPPASAAATTAEDSRKVRALIDRLPGRYRDVLTLHYLEGLSTPEVATLLDAPEATVRTRLRRGRELLRGPLAPLWTYGLLALPWLLRDAAAATGGIVVKKKAVLAGALLLLALATGGVVVAVSRGESSDPARALRTPPAPAAVAAEPGTPPAQPPRAAVASAATGVVLDRDGRPVEGASVHAHEARPELPALPFDALFEGARGGGPGARTGPDGTFRVEIEAPRTLLVEARGHSPAHVHDVRPGAHVVVLLERAPSLSGTVRDLDGNPVPGAQVAWWVFVDRLRVERRGISDEHGAYRIDDLPSPRSWPVEGHACTIAVRARGFAPVVTDAPQLRIDGDDALHRDLWLTEGSVIEGRVVDMESGAPVPHARVALATPVAGGRVTLEETHADDQGRFVLRTFPVDGFHWAPGMRLDKTRYLGSIRAEAEGYAAGSTDVPAVEAGRTVAVEVRCWRPGAVRRCAVDGAGNPVAGVRVSGFRSLVPHTSYLDSAGSRPFATTGPDGAFQWTDVPALRDRASPLNLYAHREGWPVQEADVHVRAGETTTVADFVFHGAPQPSVVAEVVDESGTPVADASVGIHPAVGARTGADGRVRIFLDAVEERRLAAHSTRSGFCLSQPFVPAVENPPVVRVVLDAVHAIDGVVEDETGAPVPGATVQAAREGRHLGATRTDGEGRFRIGRLPAGDVDLHAAQGARNARAASVATGASGVRLGLPVVAPDRVVTLRGTVRDASDGGRVLRFTAMLQGPSVLRAERPEPGAFRFAAVPEGPWKLVVAADGYAPRLLALEVDASRPPDPLDLELAGGAVLHGRVENRAGVPPGTLLLHDDTGFALQPTPLDRSGRYRIENLKPGRYWTAIRTEGRAAVLPAEIVVDEGEARVDLAIVPAGSLALRNAGPRVEVTDAEGIIVRVLAGAPPAFLLDLPPGTYAVGGRAVEVREGAVTEVDLSGG